MTRSNHPAFLPAYPWLSILVMLFNARLFVAGSSAVLIAAALIYVKRLPPVYRAEAFVQVVSQKIPEKFVPATVDRELQDELASISQQLRATAALNRVIVDFNLYSEQRKTRSEDEILAMMRRDTGVAIERGWTANRPSGFRIWYVGEHPVSVAAVANRLANIYVEENLRAREVHARGTSEFLKQQLEVSKSRLEELERAVSRYKTLHNGELPEQENSLSGRLARLQMELQGNQDSLNRIQQSKTTLENMIAMARVPETPAEEHSAKRMPEPPQQAPVNPPPRKSEALERQLESMLTRYGESHPDVRRVRRELAAVKQEEAQALVVPSQPVVRAAAVESRPGGAAQAADSSRAATIKSLESQLALLRDDQAKRATDRQRILQDIAVYEGKLQALPIREQEMASLTRDYQISKANYQALLEKKLAADIASDMERRQKAEHFSVIDPAKVPVKPFKPNRRLLAGLGGLLSVGLSMLAGIAKGFLKGNLTGEWELPPGVPVLARIPKIRSKHGRHKPALCELALSPAGGSLDALKAVGEAEWGGK